MSLGEFRADAHTVGLWLFNGTANDASGHGNHGTLQNGASFDNAGLFGPCLALDGQNDSLSIPDAPSLDITGDLTLEVWLYLSGGSAGGPDILTKGNYDEAYSLWAYQGSFSVGINGNESIVSGGSPNTTDFQYVVFTKHGTAGKFYLDGEQVDAFTVPATIETTTGALMFSTATYPVEGSYDSVRISNVARSAKDIRQHYALTKGLYGGR